jgi:2-polyprenyl-3-methyl-5-hydroxy-6-metoxy-1,4-benzoquinol methylase
MAVSITSEALVLNREFSNEEYKRYARLIDERRSSGYYHHVIIEDAAGKRLETPGTHECLGVISLLDHYGFPRDLTGKTVLDVGCNSGFYSFVAKLRGAKSVLGLDASRDYTEQALLLREILGLNVEFHCIDGHSLDENFGSFDFVICGYGRLPTPAGA